MQNLITLIISNFKSQNSLHPTPYALLPTPYSLPPTPCTLLPTPYSLHPAPSARRAGFTLLEILVALAISGIALIVVLQLFGADLKNISTSEDYIFAVAKAEEKMRELMDNQNLSEGSWSEATPEGYKIAVSIKDSQKERTQNLKVKLLEIDLTIHWTNAAKERTLTLKSMKVVNKNRV